MPLNFKYFPLLYFLIIALEGPFLYFNNRKELFSVRDTVTNVLTGSIGVVITGALIKTSVVYTLFYLYNYSILRLNPSYWSFALCLISLDFLFYIGHRFSHVVNIGWAAHIVHHSSDKFNFSTAIRQGWTQHYLAIFYLPLSLIGFHPNIIISCYILSGAIQFFQHTQLVGKLPFVIECIIVTPAHHKVHHAQNPEYHDRNYGGIFIIWDRLFGTFVKEQKDIPVVFGIAEYNRSYNLLYINFKHYSVIINQIIKSRSWRERLGYIFKKPGWKDG